MRPWCNSGRRGRIYTWGRRQDLGDVGRVPIGAALESCQEAARLPHRHPRRDDEGCLRLHNLPTTEQAAVIREVWGSGRRWKCRPRPWSASARLILSRSHALRQEFDQTLGSSKCPATPIAPHPCRKKFDPRCSRRRGQKMGPGYRWGEGGRTPRPRACGEVKIPSGDCSVNAIVGGSSNGKAPWRDP